MNSDEDRYAIRSVDRALDILECVAGQNGELTVDQIVSATGLPKSTAFRVLATLTGRRLLERDPQNQTYRLGMLALVIGARAMGDLDLRRAARPHLENLVAVTGETVHLSILSADNALCIDKVDASRSMRMASFVGFLDPLHCSGVGKALLAFQDEPVRQQLIGRMRLDPHTRHTITDPDRLVAQIDEIRARGYAVDDEEIEEGLRCVAAPIRDHSGSVIAAVSISGPTTRVTDASLSDLAIAVEGCAQTISRELGAPQGKTT
ncbi:MAG: IclR family transcriptional regulator [Devosia sp.]|uniref:IclR family transcriptional regulator n=1 Tax=Devosia sp. TaxID=1871048 RepID=UPI001ACE5D48|nr:IclR family transcriptional regulator [Devosia sp.]MBN9316820.1 IclR family transcriptional regulator [Devosia sp.]